MSNRVNWMGDPAFFRWLSPSPTDTTLDAQYILKEEAYSITGMTRCWWTLSRHAELPFWHNPYSTWATLVGYSHLEWSRFFLCLKYGTKIYLWCYISMVSRDMVLQWKACGFGAVIVGPEVSQLWFKSWNFHPLALLLGHIILLCSPLVSPQ